MSGKLHKSARSRLDLLQHFIYIGERNLDAGKRFLAATQKDCLRLAEMPGLGTERDFGNPKLAGMRSWPIKGFENFLIFYMPTKIGINIVRIIHGAQALDRIFAPDPVAD